MFGLSFELAGSEKIIAELDDVLKKVEDFSPVWELIASDFYSVMGNKFATGGGSKPWEPLSAKYAEWKARTHPGKPLMVLEGNLRASLTGPNSSGSIKKVAPKQLTLGTSVKNKSGYHYPYAHQYGLGNNKVRELIDISDDTVARWKALVYNHAFSTVAGASAGWSESIMSDYGFDEEF